jgi:hypothetical protein
VRTAVARTCKVAKSVEVALHPPAVTQCQSAACTVYSVWLHEHKWRNALRPVNGKGCVGGEAALSQYRRHARQQSRSGVSPRGSQKRGCVTTECNKRSVTQQSITHVAWIGSLWMATQDSEFIGVSRNFLLYRG